jgi:hypothetical protein
VNQDILFGFFGFFSFLQKTQNHKMEVATWIKFCDPSRGNEDFKALRFGVIPPHLTILAETQGLSAV